MHSTVLVAALAAAAGVAHAAPERPRIYFPRNIKRQFTNTTVITTPAPPTASSFNGPTAPITTTRDTDPLSALSSLLGLTDPPVSLPDGLTSTDSSDSGTTTVVVTSSIVLPASGETPTVASTGSVPPIVILPTTHRETSAVGTPDSQSSSSSTGILVAPFGVITATTPTTDPNPLAPLTSLLSSVISEVTSLIVPTPKNTTTPSATSAVEPTSSAPHEVKTSTPPATPTTPPPLISLSLSLFPTSSSPPHSSEVPSSTHDLPTSANITVIPPPTSTSEPLNSTVVLPPPTSDTSLPISSHHQSSLPPTSVIQTSPPPTSIPTPPAGVGNSTASANATEPETSSPVTSIPAISTLSGSQPWLPTTILIQPSTTGLSDGGLAPTSSMGLPSSLPKAITPDSADDPTPEDCTPIQVGFGYGLNYRFVVQNAKSAAQIFHLLPQGLAYDGGFSTDRIQMRKLVPMDTSASLGYVTTLAILCYPSDQIDALRMDVRTPTAPLYHPPDELVANLTAQINSGIDIIIGSGLDDDSSDGTDGAPGATSTANPNGDMFSQPTDAPSPAQQGTAVGITFGAISVAAAYGAAMFIIARRYKRKRQSHRRTSSVSAGQTETVQTGSPALLGGALLSRDFSSFGNIAGGRDSHGSGQSGGSGGTGGSGAGNSVRTAYISAPVAQENSLGWN